MNSIKSQIEFLSKNINEKSYEDYISSFIDLKKLYLSSTSCQSKRLDIEFEELDIRIKFFKEKKFLDEKKLLINKGLQLKFLKNRNKVNENGNEDESSKYLLTNTSNLKNIVNLCDEVLEDYSNTCNKSNSLIPIIINEQTIESFCYVDLQMNNPINLLNKYILEIYQIKFECEKVYQDAKDKEKVVNIGEKEQKVKELKQEVKVLIDKYKTLEVKYNRLNNK